MKKIIVFMLLLAFSLPVFAQDDFVVDYGKFDTFRDTLTNASKDSVILLYPIHKRNITYFEQATPTGALLNSSRKVYDIAGDLVLHLAFESIVGAGDVVFWTKNLVWNPITEAYEHTKHDSTFLDLDTPATYTSASADTLTYTEGVTYICPLTSHLQAVAGKVIYYSTDDNGTTTDLMMWYSFTRYSSPGMP